MMISFHGQSVNDKTHCLSSNNEYIINCNINIENTHYFNYNIQHFIKFEIAYKLS